MTALHEITGYPYASNPLHDWKYERQFVNMFHGDVSDNSCSAYLAARATLRAKRIAAELELARQDLLTDPKVRIGAAVMRDFKRGRE